MVKKERIVRYTADEMRQMVAEGKDQTNWAAVDALTEEELEASIDEEDEGQFDWGEVFIGLPPPKQQLTVRLDSDVIDWFKAGGAGYQTRMNAVLRGYVNARKTRDKQAAGS